MRRAAGRIRSSAAKCNLRAVRDCWLSTRLQNHGMSGTAVGPVSRRSGSLTPFTELSALGPEFALSGLWLRRKTAGIELS